MNFNHLEYAVAVAKAGSIRKASQNLYVSQPYLSGMLKGLEKELGYHIFNRTAAGITLTREGEAFIRSAKVIMLEFKKIKGIDVNKEERQLNISCYYSTYIMEKFLKFHNASTYKFSDKMKEMGNKEVLEAVSSGDSTIGIIYFAKEKQRKYLKMVEDSDLLAAELLKPQQVYATMHNTHPLAESKGMYMADLSDYPYVVFNDESSRSYLDILGIKEHPELLEVSDRGSFLDALRSGEYLTSACFLNPPEKGELVALPFLDKEVILYTVYVTAKNYRLSKREKEFIEFVRS